MAEATGDKLGFKSNLRGHTNASQSGTRVLEKTEGYNPLTFVERGRVGAKDYYQQRFQPRASSPFWRGYAIDKDKNVTGVLLDNDILLWIAPDKRLVGSVVSGLVEKKYPKAKILARFHLVGKPTYEDVPELRLESGLESFDGRMDDLVEYFGRSLDWREGIVRLKVSHANGQQSFEGTLQEYLMLSRPLKV